MAVAFLFEATGVGAEDYDGLMAALGRSDIDAPAPPGFIAHLAGPTDVGWRAVDVWESDEAASAFYGSEAFQTMLAGAPPINQTPWPLHRIEVDQTLRQLTARAV